MKMGLLVAGLLNKSIEKISVNFCFMLIFLLINYFEVVQESFRATVRFMMILSAVESASLQK